MRTLWSEVDKNADGKLDKREIRKLLEKINYQVAPKYFDAFFSKHDKDKSNTIEFKEFLGMMQDLHANTEIDKIFD